MYGSRDRCRKLRGAIVLAVALFAIAGCGSWFGGDGDGDGPLGRTDPVINGTIQASVAKGAAGEMVTFSVSATDPQGDALTYAWDDGDPVNGTFSEKGASEFSTSNTQVSWMTNVDGNYLITVVVKDGGGNSDSTSFLFPVGDGGGGAATGPVITSLTVNNANPEPGEDVDLTVTATDPNGDTLTYSWSDNGGGGAFSGSGASVSYSNNAEGTYTLTVTVSDGTEDASFSTTIVVEAVAIPNEAPVFDDPLEGDVSEPFATQKILYDHIKATDPDGDMVTYSWDASGPGEFTEEQVNDDGYASAFFAADEAGAYVVTLTADDGKGGVSRVSAMTSVQSEFDAAAYPEEFDFVGYAFCLGCHPDKGDEAAGTGWFSTNHSIALEKSINPSSYGFRNEGCYQCHALGWEPNDSGQGFIDQELTPEFRNIQCESCHGGGNPPGMGLGHKGVVWNPLLGMMYDEAEMTWVPDYDFDSSRGVGCGACHEGSRHGAVEEWAVSAHNLRPNAGDTEEDDENPGTIIIHHNITGSSCAKCHNGQEFVRVTIDGEEAETVELTLDDIPDVKISCATCHDPHSADNERQLRIGSGDGVAIPFSDTDDVPTMVEGGWGNICIECHNGRRDRGNYDSAITNGSGHFGPHGNAQGPMLFGIMGADLGVGAVAGSTSYETDHPHRTWNENTCVTCHMYRRDYIDSDNPTLWGHSFEPRFERCVTCHSPWEGDEEGFWNWVEEHETEVEELMQAFRDAWPEAWKDEDGEPVNRDTDPPTGVGPARDDPVGNAYRAALWNYMLVEEDQTHGTHNPAYTHDLMEKAIASVQELNEL